jgi:hypothetical protein
MYDHMMKKFTNGHADVKGVYFDEENRRHLYQYASLMQTLQESFLQEGKKIRQKL